MSEIGKTSAHGIFWTMLRVLGQTGISFGVGVLLARLLDVADFGLMAIAYIFIGLAELLASLGVEGALIQRKTLDSRHISVALTLSVGMALSLLLLFWLASILAANFFAQPTLEPMLQVLGLGQCCASLAMVPRAMLRREFRFKLLSQIELSTYIVGYVMIAVPLALLGYGVWSLVIGTCGWLLLSALSMFVAARHHLPRQLLWSVVEARDLLHFGLQLTGKYVLNYVANQSSSLIIGRLLDAYALGLFSRATQIAQLPMQKIAYAFSSVMFPIYASIQHSTAELKQAYLRTVAAVSVLTIPPLVIAGWQAEVVVEGLFGEKWLPAAPVFSALCVAAIFNCILHLSGALVEASNQISAEIKRQISYFVLIILGFALASRYGIEAIAWVAALAAAYLYLIMSQLVLKLIKCSWGEYLRVQAPAAGISTILLLIVIPAFATIQGSLPNAPLRLTALIAIAASGYITLFLLTPDRWMFGAKAKLFEKLRKRRNS